VGAVAVRRPGPLDRERFIRLLAAVIALAVLIGVAAGKNPVMLTMPVAAGAIFCAIHRWLLSWRTLIAIIFLTIMLIPMKRYALLPGSLPIQIEPYRILIAAVAAGWFATLLVDRSIRLRPTGLEAPLLGFVLAVLISVAANSGRVAYLGVGGEVIKKVTFLLSFVIMVYLIVSVVERRRDLEMLIRVLVFGGAIVAVLSLYESRTGINYFDRLHTIFPPLRLERPVILNAGDDGGRGGRLRVFASAEHPIALSAALAMLIPLAIYLARRDGKWRWWFATTVLALGVVSTVSRTGITMMVSIFIVYACVKPASTRRALPMLLPLIVAMHVAVPGAIGGLKSAFFPPGGVVAEQQYGAGTRGSGRLADLGPGLAEWRSRPFFGEGYATRISDVDDPRQNAGILDNQWLGTLLETGLLGAGTIFWLFARTIRRLSRAARRDDSAHGLLLAGLAASLTAYCVGMFTFDAFNFFQVTFLAFICVGLGAAAVRMPPEPGDEPAPARVRERPYSLSAR
jgi:polysaccharide biosynthesis protein PslJ